MKYGDLMKKSKHTTDFSGVHDACKGISISPLSHCQHLQAAIHWIMVHLTLTSRALCLSTNGEAENTRMLVKALADHVVYSKSFVILL